MTKNIFEPPCEKCQGSCCKYIAIEIGKPTSKTDFDHMRWYLLHENVNIFLDHEKKWHVEFRTPCLAQSEDFKCKVYKKRPKICKDHGTSEDECEYYDLPYIEYFSTLQQFEKYLTKKNIDWKFKS